MEWYLSGAPTRCSGQCQMCPERLPKRDGGQRTSRPLGYKHRKDMTLVAEVAKFDLTPARAKELGALELQSEHGPPLGGPNLTRDSIPFVPAHLSSPAKRNVRP